jgi:hypothetical protein
LEYLQKMSKAKRIFFIADTKEFTDKLLKNEDRRLIKGLIRAGHDVQVFNYRDAFLQGGLFMSMRFTRRLCKTAVADKLLTKQIMNYNPDMIFVRMINYLDGETVQLMKSAAPHAPVIGIDNNIWPELHDHCLDAAAYLDLLVATYSGKGIEGYQKTGVQCAFLPSNCDPDIEYRYDVSEQWKSNILFTGQTRYKQKRYLTEDTRHQLLSRLANMPGCALYGYPGRPKIGGIQYLYAISGAKIGLSVNAVNDIELYHSDRLTTYLSCGTFVLAKRVPDSDLLFQDGVHLRYFDEVEEFFDLADWHLKHEEERARIAAAGMEYAHAEFNCVKMAQYLVELAEKGRYTAPWTSK